MHPSFLLSLVKIKVWKLHSSRASHVGFDVVQ
jgi:hypothetical protein